MSRVGEILLEHGWVEATSLQRAIAEQKHAGKRLCSMLIARGLLDPDHASRALGEQHNVAAVLQKHLENRERDLAKLIPSPLARAWIALPIGRMRNGELIVCVRDPRPELHAAISQTVGGLVVLAVAPAHQLERLVEQSYEVEPGDDFEVDMNTGPIVSVDVDLGTGPIVSVEPSMPGFDKMTLVGLDDVRVAKDPSQSGQFAVSSARAPITLPPAVGAKPTKTVSKPAPKPSPKPSASSPPVTLAATIAALGTAATRDAASDLAMRYAGARWSAALLMTVKEGAALGHRGVGPQLTPDAVQALAVPLTAPSLVKVAHETRRLATDVPSGAIQTRLSSLLGQPTQPAAAPVIVGPHIACVFVVGDPIDGNARHVIDLDELVDALGAAYLRIVKEKKS